MGGRGGYSGVSAMRNKSNSVQRSSIAQKLSAFEETLKSRFKTYQIGEALIVKSGSNSYGVYDLKRIPIDNQISNTLTKITPTLKGAKEEATTLDKLIKRDNKNRRVR